MAMMENVKTLNSAIRTMLAVAVVGGGGFAAWFGWTKYNSAETDKQNLELATEKIEKFEADLKQTADALNTARGQILDLNSDLVAKNDIINDQSIEITELNTEVAEQLVEIEHLDTAMRLLKVDSRLARLSCLKKSVDADGNEYADIEFVEVNNEGTPIEEPRRFRIMGDVVYIDYWVVKFEDRYIEEADLARSTSLALFRRIFGERQQAIDGYVLDEPGSRPTAYARGTKMSEFEKEIWDDFWVFANDRAKAESKGIRVANGEAVYTKVEEGKSYRLVLRASDGLSIIPETKPIERLPPVAN